MIDSYLFIVFYHSDLLFTNSASSHHVFSLKKKNRFDNVPLLLTMVQHLGSRWNPALGISYPILNIGLLLRLLQILLGGGHFQFSGKVRFIKTKK